MRNLIVVVALPLAACATSMASLSTREAQEVVVSPKSVAEIERCLVLSQPGVRTPYAADVDGGRDVTFMQEGAGAVMLFELRPLTTGTQVTFRRKSSFVNFDDDARACYR